MATEGGAIPKRSRAREKGEKPARPRLPGRATGWDVRVRAARAGAEGTPAPPAPVGGGVTDAADGRRTTGAACPGRRGTGAVRGRPGSGAAARGSRGGPPSPTPPQPRGRRPSGSTPLAKTPKRLETRADFGLPGAGSGACRAVRGPTPPPALRALVARAARRLPPRGGVAVDDVRGDEVGRRDDDGPAPVRAARGEQRQQQCTGALVLGAVPARLARRAPALALAAGRAGQDAGGRVPVVAGADHGAGHRRARALRSPLCLQRSHRRARGESCRCPAVIAGASSRT